MKESRTWRDEKIDHHIQVFNQFNLHFFKKNFIRSYFVRISQNESKPMCNIVERCNSNQHVLPFDYRRRWSWKPVVKRRGERERAVLVRERDRGRERKGSEGGLPGTTPVLVGSCRGERTSSGWMEKEGGGVFPLMCLDQWDSIFPKSLIGQLFV